MASQSSFWENGYEVVPDFLSADELDLVAKGMETSRRLGKLRRKAFVVPQGADDEYGPVAGELILRHCRPKIEAAIGRDLLECFAFWRIYPHGSELVRHVDREAAEVSVTITILSDPDGECSPFFVEDLKGEVHKLDMPPGTGVIYQGLKIPHWREPLEAKEHWQMFMHYVLKDGENAALRFDGRSEGLTRKDAR